MGRRSDARTRLVTSAGQLFRERGFSSVGVAQLCKAAGVNKGSFYHFFPSKRELLLEVIDHAWDETGLLSRWEGAVSEDPIGDLREYLEELFAHHYADQESSGHVRGSLVANIALELGSRDGTVASRLDALLDREVSAFARVLEHASAIGRVKLSDPSSAARAMVACLHGLVLFAKVKNDLQSLPRTEHELLRLAGLDKDS